MTSWREQLDGPAADDVAALDHALGVRLPHREVVAALVDPRGPVFQRLEYVGDSLLDAVVVQALVAREPWLEPSLAHVDHEQQALVSDHALGRVAARRGLPHVRTFPASRQRLADRIEACIGAAWADVGLPAAERLAWRLVLDDGLAGHRSVTGLPDLPRDRRYEEAARGCGHEVGNAAWFAAAAAGGAARRRLAVLGNAVLEATCSAAQYAADPAASEAAMSEERRRLTSNAVLAVRAAELGLGGGDAEDRRAVADEAQSLVGAATMDRGIGSGFALAAAILRVPAVPGPVAFGP